MALTLAVRLARRAGLARPSSVGAPVVKSHQKRRVVFWQPSSSRTWRPTSFLRAVKCVPVLRNAPPHSGQFSGYGIAKRAPPGNGETVRGVLLPVQVSKSCCDQRAALINVTRSSALPEAPNLRVL